MARLKKINAIVVHASASTFGCARLVESWHIERGFEAIGYHRYIGNGYAYSGSEYDPFHNGAIEMGRPPWIEGAHAGGAERNHDTLGICMTGDPERVSAFQPFPVDITFTIEQLEKLRWLIRYLLLRYGLNGGDIFGHGELDGAKPNCPGLDMDNIREYIEKDSERRAFEFLRTIKGAGRAPYGV